LLAQEDGGTTSLARARRRQRPARADGAQNAHRNLPKVEGTGG
jgi:hypothetical protein